MRGPLYVVAQNVRSRVFEVLGVLKVGFAGGLNERSTRRGCRTRCLYPFYVRQVDCPALRKSAPYAPQSSS